MAIARKAIRTLLSLFHFGLGWPRGTPPDDVRILLYHRINTIEGDPVAVRPGVFALQMRYLAENFRVIGMRDLLDGLNGTTTFQRTAIITFDDGYRDTLEHAIPILKHMGFPASFFVPTGLLGTDRRIQGEPDGMVFPKMEWADIKGLAEQGFEIGAHSVHHVSLGSADQDRAIDEILRSKRDLESRIGEPVRYFSYPFGRPGDIPRDNRVHGVLRDNFDLCCTGYRGPNIQGQLNPFHLHRISIRGAFGFLEFKAELAGVFDFYNWRRSYLKRHRDEQHVGQAI
jgi:peptidoglycan/xylan/chitin deacetylase (PgdA/CDA1 family)